MTEPKCPDCESSSVLLLADCVPFLEGKPCADQSWNKLANTYIDTQLWKCTQCFLKFRSPAPTESQLNAMYSQLHTSHWDYQPAEVSAWVRAKTFLAHNYANSANVKILDIGAYDGKFLQFLDAPFQKYAIEPATSQRPILEQKQITWIGSSATSSLENFHSYFDVITLFDVFEHLTSPQQYLKRVRNLLKRGGTLLISTANSDHWTWRYLSTEHWYLNTLQHVCFGSPRYFQRLAPQIGFQFVDNTHHSHMLSPLNKRLTDAFYSWHFARKNKSLVAKAISKIARYSKTHQRIVHQQSGPYTPALRDHMFLQLRAH